MRRRPAHGGEAAHVDVLVREAVGIDGDAMTNQVRDSLELAVGLWIFGIAAAVETDGRAHDSVLHVEAEELAARRGAPEDKAVPGGREAHIFDEVLVLIGPKRVKVIIGQAAIQH